MKNERRCGPWGMWRETHPGVVTLSLPMALCSLCLHSWTSMPSCPCWGMPPGPYLTSAVASLSLLLNRYIWILHLSKGLLFSYQGRTHNSGIYRTSWMLMWLIFVSESCFEFYYTIKKTGIDWGPNLIIIWVSLHNWGKNGFITGLLHCFPDVFQRLDGAILFVDWVLCVFKLVQVLKYWVTESCYSETVCILLAINCI